MPPPAWTTTQRLKISPPRHCQASLAIRTTNYLEDLGVEFLNLPTYSPDLTNKDKMGGLILNSPKAAIITIALLEAAPLKRAQCFQDWFNQMYKCIDCHREYFKNQRFEFVCFDSQALFIQCTLRSILNGRSGQYNLYNYSFFIARCTWHWHMNWCQRRK